MTGSVFLCKKWINLPTSSSPHFFLNPVQNRRRGGRLEKSNDLILGSVLLYIRYHVIFNGARHCSKCLKYTNPLNPQNNKVGSIINLILQMRHREENNLFTATCTVSGRARFKPRRSLLVPFITLL